MARQIRRAGKPAQDRKPKPPKLELPKWLNEEPDLGSWPTYPDGTLAIPFPPFPVDWTSEVAQRYRVLTARLYVESYRRRFEQGRNPVYAWRAYAESRGHHLPIPGWVLEYLDSPAGDFWQWSMAGRPPEGRELGEALVDALLMRRARKGPGTVFGEVFPDKDSMELAAGVHLKVRLERFKVDQAVDEVAKAHKVHRSTVLRAWARHKVFLQSDGADPSVSKARGLLK